MLKQFALPVLCELAAASPRTRELLSKYDGVSFYIDLLRESYWQMHAISAIHTWYVCFERVVACCIVSVALGGDWAVPAISFRLTLDLDQVQGALLLPRSVQALYDLFKCPHIVTFSSILPLFLGTALMHIAVVVRRPGSGE